MEEFEAKYNVNPHVVGQQLDQGKFWTKARGRAISVTDKSALSSAILERIQKAVR